ncbi:MAG: FAD:protein FMN transferase [Alistipes sp.]|jgi:thiamine biosynthesis lipoprotein|nr:FAD:protein FMN transferase [Alistipes sp.]
MRLLVPLLSLLTVSCVSANYWTFSHFAHGTTYHIVVKNPPAGTAEKIADVFSEIDMTFSMFNPESLTSRINRNETDAVTPLFEYLFAMAKQVNAATDGYFDSTVAPLVDAWGFGPSGVQAEPDVDSLMEFVGMGKVRIKAGTSVAAGRIIKDEPRVRLDFSSIAKGFTVDRLALMLDGEGVDSYMVEVGGEVRVKGTNEKYRREWRIQIDKPAFGIVSEREAMVAFSGGLRAIATSGNYRNWFVDESGRTRVHTIDPLTGFPSIGEILSVSIVAAECALADAWATGIMASGTVERAQRMLERAPAGIEYYVVSGDEGNSTSAFHSPGFPLMDN